MSKSFTDRFSTKIYGTVQRAYDDLLREQLPRRPQTLKGVTVPDQAGLLDRTLFREDHEPALIDGIHRVVEPGDSVLVLGAGRGVSCVHAAIWAGQHGYVEGYEASGEMYRIAQTTIEHAPTPCTITVHHQAVGEVTPGSEARFGPADGGHVDPETLPDYDVLVCDIEGAEPDVLAAMVLPDRVIVEAHPHLGAPLDVVADELADAGIETTDISDGYEPDVLIGERDR